jgi:LmbE family N-acetylglucosaminyl deacetylase
MGLETIMSAKKIILLASGKEKAQAVAKAIEGPVSKVVPASLLQLHPDVTFILDKPAASKLKRKYNSVLNLINPRFLLLNPKDLPKEKNILVISPHPDDASISLGGILTALSKDNKIYIAIMTSGYRSYIFGKNKKQRIKIREQEVKRESKILGTKPIFLQCQFYEAKDTAAAIKKDTKKVLEILKKIKPDIIFLPHKKDSHPTHTLSRKVVLDALKRKQRFDRTEVELWFYEGPWAIFAEDDFNTIFAFGNDLMNKKMRAVKEQRSQIARTRFDLAAKALAELRSALIPEQALFGFGSKTPKVGKYFELFKVIKS